MATYVELQKQIEALQKEAEALKSKERDGVIERMKEAISVYEISAEDLGLATGRGMRSGRGPGMGSGRRGPQRRAEGTAYADGKGNTWGGRGPRPRWLKDALANGAQLTDFAKG
jgi:DNA-binding protein H-NS